MKVYMGLSVLVLAVVIVQCSHTFMGTNVFKQLVFHRNLRYSANMFTKRIEVFDYSIPSSFGFGRNIQGILAYDLSNTTSSANVTSGGIGYPYVSLRMKSDRRKDINFDVYIYA